MNAPKLPRVAAPLFLMVALMACSDVTGSRSGRVPLSLSFSTRSFVTPKASAESPFHLSADLKVGAAGELVITKVQVVLKQIELSVSPEGICDGQGGFECEELEQAPLLADLPVANGIKTALTVPVTPGTYSRLDAEIGAPENDKPGYAAFVAANPNLKDKSLRVEGTYGGVPFVYYALVNADLEMKLVPPLVVTAAGTNNITVEVDVASWFKGSGGAALDPSNPANASTILANIRTSFKAFGDNNKDGLNDQNDGG